MNSIIEEWILDYNCKDRKDYEQAIKEILQNIVLLGLSRTNFFKQASFYGGTALRIFHGLQRYSEDLDFTLRNKIDDFKFENYFKAIEIEMQSFGFEVSLEKIQKMDSDIDSAFLKMNTKIHFLKINTAKVFSNSIQKNENLKIKFEIDTDPVTQFSTEIKTLLRPVPFTVDVLTPSCLFGGKMHALLFRKWKNRVKGRDFYDFIYYISRKVPLNLKYLEFKMRASNSWTKDQPLDRESLTELYRQKILNVDFESAKLDVSNFITDQRQIELWSIHFFMSLIDQILVE